MSYSTCQIRRQIKLSCGVTQNQNSPFISLTLIYVLKEWKVTRSPGPQSSLCSASNKWVLSKGASGRTNGQVCQMLWWLRSPLIALSLDFWHHAAVVSCAGAASERVDNHHVLQHTCRCQQSVHIPGLSFGCHPDIKRRSAQWWPAGPQQQPLCRQRAICHGQCIQCTAACDQQPLRSSPLPATANQWICHR